MLSLSSFIAQSLPKFYNSLPELRIEIWPPYNYPKREVEILYLYERLKRLRDELRKGPQLHYLSVHFLENREVKWAKNGVLRASLSGHDYQYRNDIEILLDHLAFITNVDKATVRLPPSLAQNEYIETHLNFVIDRMEGRDLEDGYPGFYSEVTKDLLENPFEGKDVRSVEESFFYELQRSHARSKKRSRYQDYYAMFRTWYTAIRDDEEHRPIFDYKCYFGDFGYDEDYNSC